MLTTNSEQLNTKIKELAKVCNEITDLLLNVEVMDECIDQREDLEELELLMGEIQNSIYSDEEEVV